jgi:hypothetical protein
MLRYLRNRARLRSVMSAFGGKADIAQGSKNEITDDLRPWWQAVFQSS